MKIILMLCLFLGFALAGSAQILTIKDRETNQPVEIVNLISENPRAYAITNAEGQADISEFKGAAHIHITRLGYKAVVKSFAEIENSSFIIQLEPSVLNLDEVVFSATRWRQSSGNTPSKVATISPREVALQNPQTAADLLGISGKVFIQKSQQGGGSPMIRGFATNRLLYTIDGVRMNTAIFRSGNIQNVISLDPFAIANTEVLFGPGSVMYGSDAIGGVMSFQTLSPQLSLKDNPLIAGTVVTRYSSANNERTAHFDINVGWKKWAFVSSISSFDYDHLRQGSHGPDDYLKPVYVQRIGSMDRIITQDDPLLQVPSAYSQINIMQKVRFKPNEKWDFVYGFHFSETSPYGRYDRHNRLRNGQPRYAEWNYGPQKWMMNNLNITHSGNNELYDDFTLRLAQQTFGESRIDRVLNDATRTTQAEEVMAYSVSADFIKATGAKNTVTYGVEYILNDVASTGVVRNIETGNVMPGPARYPQAQWQSMAAFVQDQFKVSEKLTLQAGLRYNRFALDADFDTTFYPFPFTTANINSGSLTGSAGAVFRPSETWVFSASFGTAFRSPNVDDLGKVFDSEPGAVTVPNPGLEAEYAYNFDLGIAKVFGDRLKLDITGYYTLLENALVRRNFSLNGQDSIIYRGELSRVQAIQNAAVANIYGIQAGIEFRLGAGFRFSSDLNYQQGEEELDDGSSSASRHAAPMFGVSRLNFKANDLSLQLYAMYQGEKSHLELPAEEQQKTEIYALDGNGDTYSPSWYTLNFKAQYQFTKMLGASAGIENLTDQRYRPFASGISAPGRNFILTLNARF
ncbi:MAG: TonB-dependent receptor [Bacteroidia bacterium]